MPIPIAAIANFGTALLKFSPGVVEAIASLMKREKAPARQDVKNDPVVDLTNQVNEIRANNLKQTEILSKTQEQIGMLGDALAATTVALVTMRRLALGAIIVAVASLVVAVLK